LAPCAFLENLGRFFKPLVCACARVRQILAMHNSLTNNLLEFKMFEARAEAFMKKLKPFDPITAEANLSLIRTRSLDPNAGSRAACDMLCLETRR
jgi:hypothetical protein